LMQYWIPFLSANRSTIFVARGTRKRTFPLRQLRDLFAHEHL
jgi:hypothetical protein